MKAVTESAEHHYLTTLEREKTSHHNWAVFHFALSKSLAHRDVILDRKRIEQKLAQSANDSRTFFDKFFKDISTIVDGYAYLFCDGDVVMMVKAETDKQKLDSIKLFDAAALNFEADQCSRGDLKKDFHFYQKLSDQKFLSAKRFESYRMMADENKVSSISVRRERRSHPKVLIVEDDRFTASYTANILSKDYDLIMSSNGEEAIGSYIEHAPDIVFLDIHLPGMSGHEALQAIKAVDRKAFVVMLSVDTVKSNIMQASMGGAQNFLKKPFSKERLINSVRSSPYIKSYSRSSESVH